MGFVKSLEELLANRKETADFYDARMLTVFWETKPEVIAKLLPAPLQPAENPLAMAFVADYPRTNFDVTYQESALFISAVYDGEEGSYCLSMPVTNDMAMGLGREVLGFPKKMADIHLIEEKGAIRGWTERRGVRFMEVRAELTGKFNDIQAQELFMANILEDGSIKKASFLFKHFPATEGMAFDYNPRLVRQETVLRPKEIRIGEGEIILKHSDYDPWAEVPVVKMLGAVFMVGDNSMRPGKVMAEVDPLTFAPYAFLKWDLK
jgi:acetoacetate decarboxylase